MIHEFKLPDIGEGISEAQLSEWLVAVGDVVKEGDDVASVNTDKVEVELPAPRSGKIVELCWNPGDTIPVGAVVLRIEAGETRPAAEAQETEPAVEHAAAPAADRAARASKRPESGRPAEGGATVVAAPSTRKLAADMGVDLASLRGSGKDGRILRADVEAAARPPTAAPAASASAPKPFEETAYEREPLAGPRRAAFDRLAYSVHTLATSTMNFEVPGDALLALQDRLGPAAAKRSIKLSPAPIFAKCLAAVLLDHPRFNANIDEEKRELLLYKRVNMGVAVATDAGLTVPVVRGVERLSLFDTARAIADAAARARDNALSREDVTGGTFTLSNTGNLEKASILSTRPVVNPPQTAILWVSRITERPRSEGGRLAVGPMVACSLSFDHRFIDGADATLFINDIAASLECPEAAIAGY